jgi:hypothetical protein
MPGQLESVLKGLFDAFGKADPDAVIGHFGAEPQGVDELSREWMRGRAALEDYIRGTMTQVSDVKTEIRGFHEVLVGDIGVATFWIEQDYTLAGQRQHISAPSSAVLRREKGAWKIVLFHSIPLPE